MLGSTKNNLAVDAGRFSVKSLVGRSKNTAIFTGMIGNYVLKEDRQDTGQPAGSEIYHSLLQIYRKKSDIYTAVSLSDVIIRKIDIEKNLSEFEKESAIEVELSESLPFPLDQVYFDFREIKSKDAAEQSYLVAASRKEAIDALTSEIRACDKSVGNINVDVDAYALGRLISSLYSDVLQDNIVLLIDIAHQHSRFYFYDDKDLLFHREQQIGGKYITENIAEIYDLSFAEAQEIKHREEHDSEFTKLIVKPFANAFGEQLNLVIDFFEASAKSDKEIDKILLIGGGSCLSGLATELGAILKKPVENLSLSNIWPDANPDDGSWSRFSAHYALALSLLLNGTK